MRRGVAGVLSTLLALSAALAALAVVAPQPARAAGLPLGCSLAAVEGEIRAVCPYSASGTAQTFTVPAGVTEIVADVAGAQGGSTNGSAYYGGYGARLVVPLAVVPGETLTLWVGQQGANGTLYSSGAGGGGGTSLHRGSGAGVELLVAAGGGGGSGSNAGIQSYAAGHASLTTSGNAGARGYVPTVAGGAAGGDGSSSTAGGGAGWLGTGGPAAGLPGGGTGSNSGGGGGGYSGGGGGQFDGGTAGLGGGGGSYSSVTPALVEATHTGAGTASLSYPVLTWDAGPDIDLGGFLTASATASGGESGSVVFRLFDSADITCDTPLYEQTVAASSGQTVSPMGFQPTVAGQYRWTVAWDDGSVATPIDCADGKVVTANEVAGTVTGTVLAEDPDGHQQPFSGALVAIHETLVSGAGCGTDLTATLSSSTRLGYVRTTADGRFTLGGLPIHPLAGHGWCAVVSYHPGYPATSFSVTTSTSSLMSLLPSLRAGRDLGGLVFPLGEWATLQGKVFSDGLAVAGASVALCFPNSTSDLHDDCASPLEVPFSTTTGGNGSYEFARVPGLLAGEDDTSMSGTFASGESVELLLAAANPSAARVYTMRVSLPGKPDVYQSYTVTPGWPAELNVVPDIAVNSPGWTPPVPGASPSPTPTPTPVPTPAAESTESPLPVMPEPAPALAPAPTPAEHPVAASSFPDSAPAPRDLAQPSAITGAIPSVSEIAAHPERVFVAVVWGLLWILPLLLLLQMFDEAIKSYFDSASSFFADRLPLLHRLSAGVSAWFGSGTAGAVGLYLAGSAVISAFVDPHVGFDGATLRLILSMGLSAVATTVLVQVVVSLVLRRTVGQRTMLHASPWGLLVTFAGVALSRVLAFVPGLLLGAALDIETKDELTEEQEVRVQRMRVAVTLLFGVLGWAAASVLPSEGVVWLFLQDSATAITAASFAAMLVELLPLPLMAGGLLARRAFWHWVVLTAFAATGFALVVAPSASSFVEVGGTARWAVIAASVAVVAVVVIVAANVKAHRAARAARLPESLDA